MAESNNRLEAWAKIAQIVSVSVGVVATIVGLVISVTSNNAARTAEANARLEEAKKYNDMREDDLRKQRIEVAKPFLQMRQERYLEMVKTAAILANTDGHTDEEQKTARSRFRDMYIAELSMVESGDVEEAMVGLAEMIEPKLRKLSDEQRAALKLSRTLGKSLIKSWGVDDKIVDRP